MKNCPLKITHYTVCIHILQTTEPNLLCKVMCVDRIIYVTVQAKISLVQQLVGFTFAQMKEQEFTQACRVHRKAFTYILHTMTLRG